MSFERHIVSSNISENDRSFGTLAHILTLSGFVVPFGNILAPLILFIVKKDESPYIRHHAVEALNFQITLLIAYIIAGLLIFVLVGLILLPIILIFDVAFTIIAAIAANRGRLYRYPLTLRLVV